MVVLVAYLPYYPDKGFVLHLPAFDIPLVSFLLDAYMPPHALRHRHHSRHQLDALG